MQEQAAQAARASAPVRSDIDWSKADDDTLVRGLLKRRDVAWLVFLGRVDEIVKERVALAASRRSGLAYSADFVDGIADDIHCYLDAHKMRALRRFNSRRGTLAAWLGRLADQFTIRRMQELTLPLDRE